MRIGFANGVFDCLHAGHIYMLKECRRHCDYLIVAVNHDKVDSRAQGAFKTHPNHG